MEEDLTLYDDQLKSTFRFYGSITKQDLIESQYLRKESSNDKQRRDKDIEDLKEMLNNSKYIQSIRSQESFQQSMKLNLTL